jgi:hypothetical protein
MMKRSQQNGLHGLVQYDYHFPETSPDDWCGEFKPLSIDDLLSADKEGK